MRKYEFIYILDGALDESAVSENLEKYLKLIREQGGEITHQDIWGRRKFAYEIDRKTDGTYIYMRMQATPEIVRELNRVLRFDEAVLRTLIVIDEEWERRNAEAARLRERSGPPRTTTPAPATS